jgi:translation initiation factor 1
MDNSKLVFSTHPKEAGNPKQAETENPGNLLPPLGQTMNFRREKSGRAGKTVTALYEFQASDKQMAELARRLQKELATGGTVKNRRIELQGDQAARVAASLARMGYKPRQTGG